MKGDERTDVRTAVDEELEGIHVSEEVIAAFVSEAALSVEGVFSLGGGTSAAALTKNLLIRGEHRVRGVKVDEDEKDGYAVNVYIVVNFGTKIPEVAWNVQKRVAEGLKKAAQIKLREVNIHVQGVHFK
jgi:uncharacterized alkaline shock family protein YloU